MSIRPNWSIILGREKCEEEEWRREEEEKKKRKKIKKVWKLGFVWNSKDLYGIV